MLLSLVNLVVYFIIFCIVFFFFVREVVKKVSIIILESYSRIVSVFLFVFLLE